MRAKVMIALLLFCAATFSQGCIPSCDWKKAKRIKAQKCDQNGGVIIPKKRSFIICNTGKVEDGCCDDTDNISQLMYTKKDICIDRKALCPDE